jgi:hypothetical protein
MGMYDTIWCNYPLPDNPPSMSYQTKSLACELRRFTITHDGVLKDGGERVPYSGSCHFYGRDDSGVYHQYNAVFVDGRIQKVERAGNFWDRH